MSKYSVYQHWDPLRVCIVGQTYPPEFYKWIKNTRVRKLFEKIAIETEEDYQAVMRKLAEFDVEVLRPKLSDNAFIDGKYLPPPMTPRDYMVMIGDRFYKGYQLDFAKFYATVKDPSWPDCTDIKQFDQLPPDIKIECQGLHALDQYMEFYSSYDHIFDHVQRQGNLVKPSLGNFTNGAYVSRIGRDLYFGTETHGQNLEQYQVLLDSEFPDTRNHIVDTGGHSDSVFCAVCPGLIVSLKDVSTYRDTFPDWEVVYLPEQSWSKVKPFLDLKKKNNGRWWIPGFEYDTAVVNTVETWLSHWVGFVEETIFDVNMLIIDPRNVMVFNENDLVFDALQRYGITPHVVPFRHRYFWDGGIHCVTLDLHRSGHMKDFFPDSPKIT